MEGHWTLTPSVLVQFQEGLFKKIIKGGLFLRVLNLTDIWGFLQAVSKCKGDVFITSPQGDRLNLKSSLTKYIAYSGILSNAEGEELELELSNSKDFKLFFDFMLKGDK